MEMEARGFLIDVGVGRAVEERLIQRGYDVKAIRSLDPRMADLDIIRLAASERRIVLTMDKDFGELVFHAGEPHAGVLLLRMEDASSTKKVAAVEYILDHYGDAIRRGGFCVYQHGRLRIRRGRGKGPPLRA